jgi:hypothetical protein
MVKLFYKIKAILYYHIIYRNRLVVNIKYNVKKKDLKIKYYNFLGRDELLFFLQTLIEQETKKGFKLNLYHEELLDFFDVKNKMN